MYADPERRKEFQRKYQKQWILDNPERYRERLKRRRNHPLFKIRDKRSRLKTNYGLSLEAFNLLKCLQRHRCAICGNIRKLSVDHNHETGSVRGLLCGGCNGAIGNLNGRFREAELYMKGPTLLE
jgi:hypothetical protein